MQEPSFSINLPNVDFDECATTIIPINDDNYRATLDWFKACLRLSQNLPPANKDDYELKVIGNVKSSLTNFFQQTELSLTTLLGLEKEVTAMFQGLGPPIESQYKLSSDSFSESADEECDPSSTDPGEEGLGDPLDQLYKRFLWVTIASIILLVLLIIVLATMCWLRKYIERDMKEIFVACPSQDELGHMGSQARSTRSMRKNSLDSRKTPSPGTEDGMMELPEYEDEEYLKEYGGQEPYAYPVRFWMTPFSRKRQSLQVKFAEKESEGNRAKMNPK